MRHRSQHISRLSDREIVERVISTIKSSARPGILLSVRALRDKVRGVSKTDFDATVMMLAERGLVVLHHHDFPYSLSETERRKLVEDGKGTHYVGLAIRHGVEL